MTERPRRPAGSPNGGQFVGPLQPESDAELNPVSTPYERGFGWHGTFYASPDADFTTAEQVINYFAEHLPPDTAVAKLRRLVAQEELWKSDTKLRVDMAAAMRHWDAQNPAPGPTGWCKQV